ncbi:hypothetical protein, partial [Microbispora sp. GKU 823]|uniref:hypothetical protein n=1 Tax=Microbispora sp. GKU 823 TaxID=1652100 RepID=UPI0009D3EC54
LSRARVSDVTRTAGRLRRPDRRLRHWPRPPGTAGGYGAAAVRARLRHRTGGIGTGGANANASALRTGAGNGMVPVAPHGTGGDGERQERERTTWLLEDEDFFVSDQKTTSPRIDRA